MGKPGLSKTCTQVFMPPARSATTRLVSRTSRQQPAHSEHTAEKTRGDCTTMKAVQENGNTQSHTVSELPVVEGLDSRRQQREKEGSPNHPTVYQQGGCDKTDPREVGDVNSGYSAQEFCCRNHDWSSPTELQLRELQDEWKGRSWIFVCPLCCTFSSCLPGMQFKAVCGLVTLHSPRVLRSCYREKPDLLLLSPEVIRRRPHALSWSALLRFLETSGRSSQPGLSSPPHSNRYSATTISQPFRLSATGGESTKASDIPQTRTVLIYFL